jgi:hypothetical protein
MKQRNRGKQVFAVNTTPAAVAGYRQRLTGDESVISAQGWAGSVPAAQDIGAPVRVSRSYPGTPLSPGTHPGLPSWADARHSLKRDSLSLPAQAGLPGLRHSTGLVHRWPLGAGGPGQKERS